MKRTYKYLLMVAFVISFLFINNVQADYKATVVNPSGASCSLRNGSTGYCYYENSNLNSYVSGVVWLDTGDEVTVLTNHASIPTNNSNVCSDYYVYTSFYFSNTSKTYHGYYCNANLSSGEVSEELKNEFKTAGFPESYWSKLAILKKAHPNWSFKAIDTKLNFKDVVTNETYGDRSLLRGSMSNNYAYLDNGEGSFNYKGDYYYPYDANNDSDPWYKANYDAIAYYVDPRNFLSDMYIFQFETLSYDNTVSDDQLRNSISSVFGNDYLSRFTDYFLEAGKINSVNPIYLASLSKQEVANGTTAGTAINGIYNGMYNFYNIGASSGADPVYRGLNFAANSDESTMRPWNSEYKAIVGGAKWIFDYYVATGQDTSYFKKFDVVHDYLLSIGRVPNHDNYVHQYMQNIKAPSSEATTTYNSYYKNGLLGLSYTFYIPVYSNMPDSTSLPTKGGWPNNYLSSITINGNDIGEFNGDVETYNYNLDRNIAKVTISAKSVSDKAKIEGTGTFEITNDTTKIIKVTAENGNVKNYKLNIALTGDSVEDPVDVVTTLNNAGIKNGNKYLSGFTVGNDISVIEKKIVAINPKAQVIIKNSSNVIKTSGIISTGDKVTITVGNETKSYEVVIYGDVNGDGKITSSDYVKIKNKIMGISSLSGVYEEAADVDRSGAVKAPDYVKIKNKIMGTGTISQ